MKTFGMNLLLTGALILASRPSMAQLESLSETNRHDDFSAQTTFRTSALPVVTLENILMTDMDEAGEIVGSFRPARYLYNNDSIYLKMKKDVSVGDRFSIYVDEGRAGGFFGGGRDIHVKGFVTITKVLPKLVVGEIYDAVEDIGLGDSIGPLIDLNVSVQPKEPQHNLRGSVIRAARKIKMIGAYDFAYLDKGSKDGLAVNDTLFVFRTGDGKQRIVSGLPEVNIAKLVVVHVSDKVSTAYVISGTQPFEEGASFKSARSEVTYLQ